ncbi:MAG: DNA recombination protein RmuC [Candidatus Acididesulfobacter diazotrophicus]|uniref:DNA recombination protein RmuC n=1 Tax=Candidatus Acididesulfobacter diazotrophicus TaxID=2597226 RepID=A0A519BLW0_9DELT|nr:MAG: DNA recombination protein RmuC [Candidatus Acididesulfobacter diazotrophicus]
MINTYILISVLVLSLILIVINAYFIFFKSKKNEDDNKLLNKSLLEINSNLLRLKDAVEKSDSNIRNEIKTEFKNSRDETLSLLAKIREELANSFKSSREELSNSFKNSNDAVLNFLNTTDERLEKIRKTVENSIKSLQDDNAEKLEKMRATVDEKLHATLEKRLTESFNQVSERLESVHKGLGEMQTLAAGVGDLKKVLSNVKTRGILGEVQLENLLNDILSAGYFEKQFDITKNGLKQRVDFAIKIPQDNNFNSYNYLPVDSKFPMDAYLSLVNAYEIGDKSEIDKAANGLKTVIRKHAGDIKNKYISSPQTTDYAIMFLPTEGLYAEISRQPDLIESLYRDYKIIIAGPNTLVSILSSFLMVFRAINIEKHAGEVQNVLSAVKTEFNKFGDILKNAQDKINKASDDIDKLIGTRTRKIQSALKNVQELPEKEAVDVLQSNLTDEEESERDDQKDD